MSTTKKKRIRFTIVVILLFVLCIFLFNMAGNTKQLRSDSAGVEFITEGEIVTCVNIKGTFPTRPLFRNLPWNEKQIQTEI